MTDNLTREHRDRAANYIDHEITKYRNLGNIEMSNLYDNVLAMINEAEDAAELVEAVLRADKSGKLDEHQAWHAIALAAKLKEQHNETK